MDVEKKQEYLEYFLDRLLEDKMVDVITPEIYQDVEMMIEEQDNIFEIVETKEEFYLDYKLTYNRENYGL